MHALIASDLPLCGWPTRQSKVVGHLLSNQLGHPSNLQRHVGGGGMELQDPLLGEAPNSQAIQCKLRVHQMSKIERAQNFPSREVKICF